MREYVDDRARDYSPSVAGILPYVSASRIRGVFALPPPAAEQPEEQSLGMLIVNSNAVGLAFYLALAAFSIFGVAVAAERLVNLTRRKVLPPEFVQALRDLRRRGDDTADELLELAERSKSPIAEIVKAGVLRAGRPVPEVEKAMEDAAANQIAELRSFEHAPAKRHDEVDRCRKEADFNQLAARVDDGDRDDHGG